MVQMAHFRITGEYLTRIARDLMLSEQPAKAWRLLVETLDGEGAEKLARNLLDGTQKLVGDETVGLDIAEDKDSQDYIADVRYIFAGRVRFQGKWWRPVAKVTSLGEADVPKGSSVPVRGSEDYHAYQKRWVRVRQEFYVESGERILDTGSEEAIIFESVSEPPHWWAERSNNPQGALKAFLEAGRVLMERGYVEAREEYKDRAADRYLDQPAIANPEPQQHERALKMAEEAEEAKRWTEKIARIRQQVVTQAGDDTFVLELKDEGHNSLTIPRAPFIHYALGRTSLWKLAPAWKCCSESGLKIYDDNPYHSDWIIGAGLEPHQAYDRHIQDAVDNEVIRLQEQYGEFECAVLVDAGPVSGIVGQDIIVLPDLNPAHLDAIKNAKGIITEVGGQLAHLAQIALGRGITIMRVADARKRFSEGTKLTLRPIQGKIETWCGLDG
jgi:phosphohistidine swiveling domain-containing protein